MHDPLFDSTFEMYYLYEDGKNLANQLKHCMELSDEELERLHVRLKIVFDAAEILYQPYRVLSNLEREKKDALYKHEKENKPNLTLIDTLKRLFLGKKTPEYEKYETEQKKIHESFELDIESQKAAVEKAETDFAKTEFAAEFLDEMLEFEDEQQYQYNLDFYRRSTNNPDATMHRTPTSKNITLMRACRNLRESLKIIEIAIERRANGADGDVSQEELRERLKAELYGDK